MDGTSLCSNSISLITLEKPSICIKIYSLLMKDILERSRSLMDTVQVSIFIRDNLPTIVDFSRSSLHFDIFSTDHTNDIAIRKVNSRNGLKAAKHEQQQVSRYHRKVPWSLAATRPTNSRVVSSQLTRRINDRPAVFCTTCRAATCHTVRRLLH